MKPGARFATMEWIKAVGFEEVRFCNARALTASRLLSFALSVPASVHDDRCAASCAASPSLDSREVTLTPVLCAQGNCTHEEVLSEIEFGNGLPPTRARADVLHAAEQAGLRLIHDKDLALDTARARPWYHRLAFSKMQVCVRVRVCVCVRARAYVRNAAKDDGCARHGRVCLFYAWAHAQYRMTHASCYIMELLGLAPKGTVMVHGMMLRGAWGLVDGGRLNIFTPMHLFVFEKPET